LSVHMKQNSGLYGTKSRQIKQQNIRNTDYSALHPVWGEARILKLDSNKATDRQTDRQTQIFTQTARHTNRQTDRQTERQTDRQTDLDCNQIMLDHKKKYRCTCTKDAMRTDCDPIGQNTSGGGQRHIVTTLNTSVN